MNYPIDLDVTPGGIPKIVKLSQYDKSIPVIVATLWEGSQAYTMPTGATCYVAGTKPDNTGFEYQVSNSGNVVTIPITEQMTAVAGRVPTEVIIMTSDGRKGSANFFLDVEPAALSEDTSLSETDIPIIEQLPEKLEEAKTYANKAHQWATYGSDSEQPSATNNAKYYAEQAAQTDIGQATTISEETDTAPYLFRSSTANAEYDELVGVSVVENQLAGNTNQSSSANNISISFNVSTGKTSVTVSDTPTGYAQLSYPMQQVVQGHKYIIMADKPVANGVEIYYGGTTGVRGSLPAPKNQCVVEEAKSNSTYLQFYCGSTIAVGTYEYYVQTIDLTLAFGSSVADLIYSMEQATAGSGIAYLKSLGLLKDGYEAYNVGTMASSQPVNRVVRGFNQWDEEWELGYYKPGDGTSSNTNDRIRSKNYVRILPNTPYYFKGSFATGICYYDAEKNFISTSYPANEVRTTPENAHFLRFALGTSYGTTYNHDICINISDTNKNGTYEPYKEVTYPLGSDTLRGILTLDGNNIVANGDVKTSDGVINHRWDENTDLGASNWTYTSSLSMFSTSAIYQAVKKPSNSEICKALCERYVFVSYATILGSIDKAMAISDSGVIWVKDSAYTDATTFKNSLSGVHLIYPLATPTTEQSTPFAYPQVVMDTEEIVSDVPCGHNAKYVTLPTWMDKKIINDLVAEATKVADIEEALPSKVEESNIAPVENGSTASTSYPVGRLIMRNGTLYKVTSQIASGGTFTVGTNIQRTTLADVIASL